MDRTATVCFTVVMVLAAAAPLSAGAAERLMAPSLVLEPPAAEALAQVRGTRYALPLSMTAAIGPDRDADARWETLAPDRVRWSLPVSARGARTLDFGLREVQLPAGAELRVRDASGRVAAGPYRAADVHEGVLWTALVAGERATLELDVPSVLRAAAHFRLATVHWGVRHPFAAPEARAKSQSCHVDVACPAADAYRDQARAVAAFTAAGNVCTGQLVANTAADGRLLFLTAAHCVGTAQQAAAMVLYWNYESPTCRTPGSAASGQSLPLSAAISQTGGASLRAVHSATDTALVELNTPLPAGVTPYFAGWDRRSSPPRAAVTIHHPAGHEKRISVENEGISGTGTIGNKPGGGSASGPLLRVADWDAGSLEPASDGAALFSPEGRIVGQLSSTVAACGNDGESLFGRLSTAWGGAGSPATRLSDWLDPLASGADVFDGVSGGCAAPVLALEFGDATFQSGVARPIDLAISGGTGPYRVEWDVDGDGLVDRTVENVGAATRIAPVFPTFVGTTAFARVTDTAGCVATESIEVGIASPDIQPTPGDLAQVCGDGDNAVEPGERWQVPIRLQNQGGQALIGGHAVNIPVFFSEAAVVSGPDAFGNTLTDNSTGCVSRFVDISDAPLLALSAVGDAAPMDDGRTIPINITPFEFYGERVERLVMSTNGYLSTGAGDSGADFSNQCGATPPERGSVGARINVFWNDLVVSGRSGAGLRHQFLPRCPRPGDAAGGVACHVFQWNGMALINTEEPRPTFDFQALIYPATNQIVLQYRGTPPGAGDDASVNFRNAAASDALDYSCFNEGGVVDERSVCLFHPGSVLPDTAGIRIETPALALPDLAPGSETTQMLRFAVERDASCGSPFEIKYMGAVDQGTYSLRFDTMASGSLGGDESQCQVANCGVPQVPRITPQDGLFANPLRFGNGIGAFNIPSGPNRTIFAGQWFTGRNDRTPQWYILQGEIADAQARVPVRRFRQDLDAAAAGQFRVIPEVVGSAVVTYVSPTRYVMFWNINGVEGAERFDLLYDVDRPRPNRTGSWFPPSEPGWGMAIDDHFLPGGTAEQVIVNYLYDAAGEPVWTLGGAAPASSSMPHNMFPVHCPTCPALGDFFEYRRAAGTVSVRYTNLSRGSYDTNLAYPRPAEGEWRRNAIPIDMISSPAPQ